MTFLRATLALAATLALVPASALAHPGHGDHPGTIGATPIVDIPFPIAGPTAGGFSSPNVEFVKNFPQHTDSAGARKHGDFFYITTERDLTIYDVSKPLEPKEVGSLVFPSPGQPVYTEEDPDTNGRILLVGNLETLMVIDVSDKTDPKVLSELPDADDHTISCVLDCTWAYGSEGTIVDLRDPAKPRLSAQNWETKNPDIESEHDVTEVAPGIVLTSTQPLKLLDARTDPENPAVLAQTPKEPGRFVHANLWPRGGQDDFLLVGGEAVGPRCSESKSATFSTWDARAWRETGAIKRIDEFRLRPGTPDQGRAPESSFCVHWFDEHPNYANGGVVAIGWYEHGTHFLRVGRDGKISEVGWFLGGGGQASAAYWIDERTVYVADYVRGLDVLRFTGDISAPSDTTSAGAADAPADEAPAQTPAAQPAPAPATAARATSNAPASCTSTGGFRSTRVVRRDDRLALAFDRTAATPVSVDVFQQSSGRRIVGERLVARFTGRSGDVLWNGRANRPGRKVTDGHYVVRFRTRTAAGIDTRRIALRREQGSWSRRPAFHRRASCDLLRSFKLERPVFGGRSDRALGITYQLERRATATVTVLRGSKVVRRFGARAAEAGRTHRLRLDAARLPRGDYRVRIDVRRDGERESSSTVSRRL